MQGGGIETVRALTAALNEDDDGRIAELLSPHFFARLDDGRIYIGAEGVRQMVSAHRRRYRDRQMRPIEFTELAPGFVLMTALVERLRADGEAETAGGAWLYHLRDGRLSSVVYYPTPRAALESLPANLRSDPSQLVEAAVWAVNAGDLAALTRLLAEEVRFSLSPDGPVQQGVGALVEYFLSLRREVDDYAYEPLGIEPLGGGAVLVVAERMTRREGVTARARLDILARVEAGIVREWIVHPDAESVRAAARERG